MVACCRVAGITAEPTAAFQVEKTDEFSQSLTSSHGKAKVSNVALWQQKPLQQTGGIIADAYLKILYAANNNSNDKENQDYVQCVEFAFIYDLGVDKS